MSESDDNRLVDLLYDELLDEDAAAYRRALSDDPDARAEVEAFEAVLRTVRAEALHDPPAALDARILAEARAVAAPALERAAARASREGAMAGARSRPGSPAEARGGLGAWLAGWLRSPRMGLALGAAAASVVAALALPALLRRESAPAGDLEPGATVVAPSVSPGPSASPASLEQPPAQAAGKGSRDAVRSGEALEVSPGPAKVRRMRDELAGGPAPSRAPPHTAPPASRIVLAEPAPAANAVAGASATRREADRAKRKARELETSLGGDALARLDADDARAGSAASTVGAAPPPEVAAARAPAGEAQKASAGAGAVAAAATPDPAAIADRALGEAKARSDAGDVDGARRTLSQALQPTGGSPAQGQVLLALARLELEQRRYPAAISLGKRAAAVPDFPGARDAIEIVEAAARASGRSSELGWAQRARRSLR